MRFYKLDIRGKTLLERIGNSGLTNEAGRLIYDTDQSPDSLAFNDGSAFRKVWDEGNDGPGSGLNADQVDGYDAGNSSGQVAVSNGNKCTDLNADLFDDETSSFYRDAGNINAGTLAAARLTGTYNISITGTARYA